MRLRVALAISAASGFVALAYEIVWYRVLSVMTRGVASSFGLLLDAYLLGLAVGARASTVFCRDAGKTGDAPELRALALFVGVANVVAAGVVPAFAWSARLTDYRVGLGMVAVGAGLLGSVLPLVSHFGIDPDDRAGARLSYVYLANILGSAAGSLVTGFVLMDRLHLVAIARLLVALGLGLVAPLIALGRFRRGAAAVAYLALGACALAALASVPALYDRVYERIIYKNEFDGSQRFSRIVENKNGVIAVAEDGTVYGGGAYDGVVNTSLRSNVNGIVRAYVAGALHPAPRDVLLIGLASGSFATVISQLPGVERLTVLDINPGYTEVIAAYPEVRGILGDPKVTFVFDDGRRWLARHDDPRFDLIFMNTTHHWRAHITNLLSVEFMELARRHLAPGGVFYFNTTDSFDVQQTAARTFPYLWRITNFVAVSDSPFRFDRDRWRWLLATMRLGPKPVLDLARDEDRKLYDELCTFNDIEPRDSILERTKDATVITDDNMVVEWRQPLRYPDLH